MLILDTSAVFLSLPDAVCSPKLYKHVCHLFLLCKKNKMKNCDFFYLTL